MPPTASPDSPIATDHEGNQYKMVTIDCPTCGPGDQKVLGYRGGAHHRLSYGATTRIVQCASCSLLFPNPFPIPLNHNDIYINPDAYFTGHDIDDKIHRNRELINEIRRRTGKENPSLLEVGSGRGELLQAAKLEGLTDVVGLEFANDMADATEKRWGIKPHRMTIEGYTGIAGERRFDALVLAAVLEHVYDPNSMIRCVKQLTVPGSWVYLDIPNEPNLLTVVGNGLSRLQGKDTVYNLSPTWPPYHVFGFNRQALGKLLDQHDLDLVQVDVWASPYLTAGEGAKNKFKAFVGTQINRLANATGTAGNMCAWARRR